MTPARQLACLVGVVAIVLPLDAQSPLPPLIDMHMHALEADAQGPPPMGMCPGRIAGFPAMEPGRPWPDTFMEHFKKPVCAKPIWSPTTARELMDRTFAVMKRLNVYGVTSGSLTDQWKQASPERIIPSLAFELGAPKALSPDAVRAALTSGRYRAFGEVANQYQGFDPSDPAFDPFIAIAEELDVPMSIHVGTGPPGAPYLGFTKYRARLHSPLTIEEALIKHPKLRVSLMAQATAETIRARDAAAAHELGFIRRQPTCDEKILSSLGISALEIDQRQKLAS